MKIEDLVSKFANTTYDPIESGVTICPHPGAIHTYGQIPGLVSNLRQVLQDQEIENAIRFGREAMVEWVKNKAEIVELEAESYDSMIRERDILSELNKPIGS